MITFMNENGVDKWYILSMWEFDDAVKWKMA